MTTDSFLIQNTITFIFNSQFFLLFVFVESSCFFYGLCSYADF